MDLLSAVMIVEGAEEVESEEIFLEAAQMLVDMGVAWQLQGSIGRLCQRLIDDGLIVDNRN